MDLTIEQFVHFTPLQCLAFQLGLPYNSIADLNGGQMLQLITRAIPSSEKPSSLLSEEILLLSGAAKKAMGLKLPSATLAETAPEPETAKRKQGGPD